MCAPRRRMGHRPGAVVSPIGSASALYPPPRLPVPGILGALPAPLRRGGPLCAPRRRMGHRPGAVASPIGSASALYPPPRLPVPGILGALPALLRRLGPVHRPSLSVETPPGHQNQPDCRPDRRPFVGTMPCPRSPPIAPNPPRANSQSPCHIRPLQPASRQQLNHLRDHKRERKPRPVVPDDLDRWSLVVNLGSRTESLQLGYQGLL